MNHLQKLELRSSELRTELNQLSALEGEELTSEKRARLDAASAELDDVEAQRRAAIKAGAPPAWQAATEAPQAPQGATSATGDSLAELRSRASLGRFLRSSITGQAIRGAEAELASELGTTGIPMALIEPERRSSEQRADAVTPIPSQPGVNPNQIVPFVFSRSIASQIGVMIREVPSGSFTSPRITTSLTSAPTAKGAERQSSAAAFTSVTSTPRRISARLSVTEEDLASAGMPDFESALRQNLMLALSNALDQQLLTGNGTAPNLHGLIPQLTAPSAASTVVSFSSFARLIGSQVDGLFADRTSDIKLVVNPDVYGALVAKFATSDDSVSVANWAMNSMGGLLAHARMPASSNANVATCLVCKMPAMLPMGDDGRRAILPSWNSVAVDDIYSDSGAAIRHFSLHAIVGNVQILQPGAFNLISLKTA